MTGHLGFGELARRLVRYLNELVRRGEVSERRLARLTHYSQPHIHNVLKGQRGMSIELADQIMLELNIDSRSLFTQDELSGRAPAPRTRALPVPVLEGRLGAGRPFPETVSQASRPFPSAPLSALVNPVLAWLDDKESSMWPRLWPGDLVLLDRAPLARRRPRFEHVYALNWKGRGYIGRCQMVGESLVVVTDSPGESRSLNSPLRLGKRHVLDVVRGKLVWLGRDLEPG